ncbi:MAG: sulfurtransferase TusA family protein [Nitrospinaceae bacterium]
MVVFKTVDIRGLSFFNAFQAASKAFTGIKRNGALEIILDRKKNFTDAFKAWGKSKGCKISDIDDEHGIIRLFIKKVTPPRRN